MRRIVLVSLSLGVLSQVSWAVVLMDFNIGGPSEGVYGSFINASYTQVGGTALGEAVRVSAPSTGGGGIEVGLPNINLSAYINERLRLRASVEAGNVMPNFTVYLRPSGSSLTYHYSFATSTLSQQRLGWTLGLQLNNPSFVLDAANGFSFVGAGTTFAPSLSSVSIIGVQSNFSFPNLANRIVFDELEVVPEPASAACFAVGMLLMRRKRPVKERVT